MVNLSDRKRGGLANTTYFANGQNTTANMSIRPTFFDVFSPTKDSSGGYCGDIKNKHYSSRACDAAVKYIEKPSRIRNVVTETGVSNFFSRF